MIICLGPFCIPIWNIILFAFAILTPIRNLISRFWRKDSGNELNELHGEIPQEISPEYEECIHKIKRKINNRELIDLVDLTEWEVCKNVGLELNLPIIIDFYATWCKPCKRIYPKFLECSKEYNGIFIKLDYDKFNSFANEMNVLSLPTFQVWTLSNNSYVLSTVLERSDPNLLEKLILNNFEKRKINTY